MVRQRFFGAAAVVSALAAALVGGGAQADATYTFDELAIGTAVTTQYYGVTFSVLPQSCGNAPTLYMRIKVPNGGTSSGTRALAIDTGCPDFSPDYLRMVFETAQDEVSFTVGDYGTTYIVRAYSTESGATGLLSTQNVVIVPGSQFVGVHRLVTVTSGSANIRRIEVETQVNGLFETIDDLTFQPDPTAPIAEITLPTTVSCGCTSVQIRGTANDPDGTYQNDRAEYRPANSDMWTLIGTATTAVTNGILYNWNTTGLAEGLYFIRLTVENATELVSTDTELVHISRTFDTVSFAAPALVGGTVCPDGTVFDNWCGTLTYWVEYAPSAGSYAPVDPGSPSYGGDRINQGLAAWNTQSPALPDGAYTLRVRGQNPCGIQGSSSQAITIDNTAPIAVITTPVRCSPLGDAALVPVVGTVSDSHLGSWSLQYTGGDSSGWVTIASGNTAVINGVLGVWNTAGLRHCAYTLRLVAGDTAVRDCNSALHNTGEYAVSVDLGCEADFNRSGVVSVQDIYDFLTAWHAGCP